jgi:anaerobic magnesium-protoporphyrin IX monomethyl ester cyclase
MTLGKRNFTDLEPLMIIPPLVTQILPAPSQGAARRASTSTTSRKVVLFYPAYEGPALGPPLCILALAAPLLDNGFEVVIIDAAINADAPQSILRECSDALCLGISVLTGPMITAALSIARMVKAALPDFPVVFGGWHPTLTPEQTLENDLVDVVVRGPGEITLLEIVQRYRMGEGLDGVAGLSFKRNGKLIHNPERSVAHLMDLPAPAFHLADFDAYERVSGIRTLTYATSVGCPYACNYCTDTVFYHRRFNAYSAEHVVAELIGLVKKYRIKEVALLDSNFPVDVKRAVAIARGIYESGVRFTWTFQASTDFLSRMSDDEVRMMGASGVRFMGFGTESTSESVLKLMNKRHQRVGEMYETARKAELGGIRVSFNLIFGYPGEKGKDRVETLQTMNDIARKHRNVSFSPNIFTPYPGIPIWPQLKEMGVREPASLEEWAGLPLGKNVLPWLSGAELRRLERMLDYFMVNNNIRNTMQRTKLAGRFLNALLSTPMKWRMRWKVFYFPWEVWLARATDRVVSRRSLITGAPLPAKSQHVC